MPRDQLLYIALLCKYSGCNLLLRPLYGGLGFVLMFHRFTDKPDKRIDKGGVIDGLFFDQLLGYIRANGPDIIPLKEVPRAIAEKRKFVCLTMDDGYKDNLRIALPILERYRAPASIFIPSGVLDYSLDAWWLQIEELAKTYPDPPAAYDRMIAQIHHNAATLERLRPLFPANQKEINKRYFMSGDEIKTADKNPLIEIGGHTVTHPLLARLNEEEAYREILQNKKDLEKLLNRPVEVFAYPFGNADACGVREFQLAQKAGYKVAVTTREGNVTGRHSNHLLALPRYNLRGDLENLAIYHMFRNGSFRALKSRLKSPFITE